MVLYNCCLLLPELCATFAATRQVDSLLCPMIRYATSSTAAACDAYDTEWLRLLVARISSAGYFSALFDAFSFGHAADALPSFLHLLCEAVDQGCALPVGFVANQGLGPLGMDVFVQSRLLQTIERSAQCCAKSPSDRAAQTVLQAALQLMGAVMSRVEADQGEEAPDPRPVIRLLLELLTALPSPSGPRQREILPDDWACVFYLGYRRDLVAAVANACHGRHRVVADIVSMQGVLVVLQQCRGDDEETFVREWALLAVRNMCEVSREAQDAIRELDTLSAAEII